MVEPKPEQLVVSEEELDSITSEEIEELEQTVEEYIEICKDFNEDLDNILSEVNESPVYEKLGIELHIDVEYVYSVKDRED